MGHLVKIKREDFPLYAEQILEIENSSFPSPWSINSFKGEMEKSISNLWAIIENGLILGYLCFWVFDSEIHVINLAVHPLKRGNRIGHLLLTRMISSGISKGLKYVWLEVRPSNLPAIGLYTKLGFQEAGRRPRYYCETNEDAIIMTLELTQQEKDSSV